MSGTDEFKAGSQPDFSNVKVGFDYHNESKTATFTFSGIPMNAAEPFFRWLGTNHGLNTIGATILMGMMEQGMIPPDKVAEVMKEISEVTGSTS
ncbi:hypothetical protein R2325_16690 [Mycobacteroides chelonae]|uniref:hypothetical protein n=1 Tax=Mycobacteroides chelonae TaxID=1774 RepID=UPI002DE3A94C|nr:hypothetical protein [Mycobacteroides chelonae]MEC4873623.1 hypothetical protein [Mycobacteroides chelonae]